MALGRPTRAAHSLYEHRHAQGFAPSVRIGLHIAEALETPTRYEGRGVHIAARIAALGDADEIPVSRDVLEATEAPPEQGALREERLRGIAQPVAALA